MREQQIAPVNTLAEKVGTMVVIDSTGHADNMLKMLHDSQTYDGIFLNTDTRL